MQEHERPGAFSVEVRREGPRAVVVPCGELDLATVDRVRVAIDRVVAGGCDRVVLDLRETTFMDSTGLRLVIAQAAREDAGVSFVDGSEPVSRLFDLTGMRDRLRFEPGN
jgi:anti-anti-sigma factor